MNWQTPITALAGIAGIGIVALCYTVVFDTPESVHHGATSSPALVATTSSQPVDVESSSGAEPRPPASYDNSPGSAEISIGDSEALLRPSDHTPLALPDGQTHNPSKQVPRLPSAAPTATRNKGPSATVDAAKVATAATTVHHQTESPIAVTPTRPPAPQLPDVASQRYEGLLTKSEIGRIKLSLKLTPNQDALWPPVAAILGEMGQQQMAQVDTGQKLDNTMSGAMAQRFYYAALPLLQTLTDDQKAEVRRRARTMGLEAYAAYL